MIDLNYARDTTSGREGLDLLASIQAVDATLPVVVMTAWGTVELAVEALRRGAKDFIQKPWDNQRLLTILSTQIELSQALRKGARLEAENNLLRGETEGKLPLFIAESRSMQPVLELISRIAPSDANVLITGENGTGKDVVARTLHALSGRAARPLVTVNAGALASGTFESELFGHVKGAFTDARTDRVGRFEFGSIAARFSSMKSPTYLSACNRNYCACLKPESLNRLALHTHGALTYVCFRRPTRIWMKK